jgi:hypothetical protein
MEAAAVSTEPSTSGSAFDALPFADVAASVVVVVVVVMLALVVAQLLP